MIPNFINKVHSPGGWREQAKEKHRFYSQKFKNSRPNKKKIFKTILLTLLGLGVAGLLFATILVAWISKDLPSPDHLIERQISQSTKIFDRTGTHLLYEVFNQQRRTLVELKDLPDYVKWATIVIEDKNFYQHSGVAWLSIARAFVANLFNLSSGRGGASTLTQQFIKNAILTDEHSYIRKIKEVILAEQIESKYSKDEILKMYLNEVPYGSTNYGVEAASQSYFGKPAKDISIAEAATLAAMTQAPTKYLNHQDLLKTRRNFVIDKLLEGAHITPEQADIAKKEPLKIISTNGLTVAPHFVMYIKELLSEKYGEKMVESGGLQVITTLDFDLQKIAEEEVKNGAEQNEKKYKANNAALVAMDPKTGQVLAMVGSRDFNNDAIDGQFNVALSPRQPGSSFKPIVYVTAFAKGFTPDTKIYDTDTTFKTDSKDFNPRDYDLKERGPVTLRQALAGSLNIPAVKTLYLTGIDQVLTTAQTLGYTTLNDRSRFGLALVLGGAEVKLIEHVHAYATLANEGETVPYTSILEVKDSKGNSLEKFAQPTPTRVLEQQPVRELIDIMSDNNARAYIFGTNNPLTLPDRPVAAKTGTTNDWHDGWTMGFTPSLVTGVWTGNNNNDAMAKNADGVLTAGPIWHNFMARALQNRPVDVFTPPDPYPSDIKPVLIGQGMGQVVVKINRLNNKLATASTPPELIEERTYQQPHDILYYINKDDVSGPTPTDPTQDPQFIGWEAGVLAWAQKQGLIYEPIPTEYDNGEISTVLLPKITIITPALNETINTRDLNITLQIANEQTVEKMNYYLDDEFLDVKTSAPFNYVIHLAEASRGFHNLKVRAYTASGVYSESNVDFNLTAPDDKPSAEWIFPTAGISLFSSQFPISVKFRLFQLEKIKNISIDVVFPDDKTKTLFTMDNPTEKTISIPWNKASQIGNYTLKTQITTTDDEKYESGSRMIEVK